MNNQILFNYTTGDILSFDGEPYIGYYSVSSDGKFYNERIISEQSSQLTIQDNALAKYTQNKLYFNRSALELVKLPYTYDDIKFQPSEFVNENSINNKLSKLNDNYLELFNFTSIQTNDLPQNYTGFIGVTGTSGLQFITGGQVGSTIANAAAGLNNINHLEVISRDSGPGNKDIDTFLLICTTDDGLYTFNCPNVYEANTTFTFRASTNFVDGINTRMYENISDITTNKKDTLYISDSSHNQIYRLYIDPLVNDSRITGADLQYLNSGGALINTTGNGIVSGVAAMEFGLNELFIYSSGTRSLVVLDKDLAFNRQFSNKELKSNEIISFTVNEVDKSVYILLSDFKVLKLASDFKTPAVEIDIGNTFDDNESPTKILFSKNNSNIFYIATTNNLYKYFNVGTNLPIGKFKWSKTDFIGLSGSDAEIWDATILDEDNNYDSLFILGKTVTNVDPVTGYTGLDMILRCNEQNSRLKLSENELYQSFDLNDIFVTDRYFNNITFNKCLKKLIANLDMMVSHVRSKFTLQYDSFNELKHDGRITLTETPQYTKSYNMFVGPNETITPQVFNRCINQVIEYQQYVLSLLQGVVVNKKYPTTSPVYIP